MELLEAAGEPTGGPIGIAGGPTGMAGEPMGITGEAVGIAGGAVGTRVETSPDGVAKGGAGCCP